MRGHGVLKGERVSIGYEGGGGDITNDIADRLPPFAPDGKLRLIVHYPAHLQQRPRPA
jgi:hypothetical protein